MSRCRVVDHRGRSTSFGEIGVGRGAGSLIRHGRNDVDLTRCTPTVERHWRRLMIMNTTHTPTVSRVQVAFRWGG
eukprot:7387191-Prymnesium_polylepis.1